MTHDQTGTLHLKRGDLEPALVVELLDGDTPLTGLGGATTVRVLIRSRTGLIVDDPTPDVDPTAATVTHQWAPGETDTPGVHRAEVEVTWPGQRPRTFPPAGFLPVHIHHDLGGH